MPTEKIFIQSRNNQKIAVLLDKTENQKGLAFVMHGLGGFKEQKHLQAMTEAFLEEGFTVVRFDTRDSFGESEGNYENASITSYYQDLEDLIKWSKDQPFYQEPFYLAGHSLGGISVGTYAERFPDKIKGVAPISPVVSGKLHLEKKKKYNPERLAEQDRTGWRINESKSKPGLIKKLSCHQFKEDLLKYDLIAEADKLTMPVLIIVEENDTSTIPEQQKLLFDAIPGNHKELHIIKGAPHTFREPEHLTEIKDIFKKWIKKTN
ncbi:MAG: lysophospholipase [Nanoarchaeota archaeon]|nr:lysophospholipase [Nanoarchaeota archaeon]